MPWNETGPHRMYVGVAFISAEIRESFGAYQKINANGTTTIRRDVETSKRQDVEM